MKYVLGMDIGSTTSKCVILNDQKEIVASAIINKGTGTDGSKEALASALLDANLTNNDLSYVVATGYGRKMYDANEEVSELSCHAKGAHFLFPSVKTVIDIGGQDAKVLKLSDSGKLISFVMNDKCAAGTGRFLEVMAKILGLEMDELSTKALESNTPAKISSTCTVFAETEVISQLSNGVHIPDLVLGICESVAIRVGALAKRNGIEKDVCMTGGVAQNEALRQAMSKEIDAPILYSEYAQLNGALGAALIALEKTNKGD